LQAVKKLDANQFIGVVFGSGFEAQPSLLAEIAAVMPLLGNQASVVRRVKTASSFFDGLDKCNIKYPLAFETLPNGILVDHTNNDYLIKHAGGCGGTHIQYASKDAALPSNYYYQQQIAGRAISALFVAYAGTNQQVQIEVIGFNEQWLSPCDDAPFRYGGAVSNATISASAKQQLTNAAQKLTLEFGLVGLNSIDAIVLENGAQNDLVYVLEINPRLSATVDLYANHGGLNLLDLHIDACLDRFDKNIKLDKKALIVASKAHAIVYAQFDMVIPMAFDWPDWVADTPYIDTPHINTPYIDAPIIDTATIDSPKKGVKVFASEPICTVLSTSNSSISSEDLVNKDLSMTAEAAKKLVQDRVNIIQILLNEIR
jgi:uncharacterized protein